MVPKKKNRKRVLGVCLGLLLSLCSVKSAGAQNQLLNGRLCSTQFGCEWLLPLDGKLGSDVTDHTTRRAPAYRTDPAWDIIAEYGTPVFAMADGTVIVDGCVALEESNGCEVTIEHKDGYISAYGHLQEEGGDGNYLNGGNTLVRKGQRVTRFTVIGHIGDTGKTGYPHVHWKIRKIGTESYDWIPLRNDEFFNQSALVYCPYCQPDGTEGVAAKLYVDQAATLGPLQVNTISSASSSGSLSDLLLPGWVFFLLFTVTFVTSLMAFSIAIYFAWRWFGDPLFRKLPYASHEPRMIHLRSVLVQRLVLAIILVPISLGAAVGWTQGLIVSPKTRPVMQQLVLISQGGVLVNNESATLGSSLRVRFSSTGNAGSIAWLPQSVQKWHGEIAKTARSADEVEAVKLVMLIESCGLTTAKSPGVGAQGLMQIMPLTATGIAKQHGVPDPGGDIFEPTVNIKFGTWYYQGLLDTFGTFELAAIGYNGGPGAAIKRKAGQPIAAETERYNRWFSGMWGERHEAASPTFQAWLDAGGASLCESASYELTAMGENPMQTP